MTHHTVRIQAAGINRESNARQAIEAPFDDLLKLVNRSVVGCGTESAGERSGLGVI
jgi:hypothetical protein